MKRTILFLLSVTAVLVAWADKIPVIHYEANNATITLKCVDEGSTTVTTGDGDYKFHDATEDADNGGFGLTEDQYAEGGTTADGDYYDATYYWPSGMLRLSNRGDCSGIKEIVIDESFKEYKPKLTSNWFNLFYYVTEIKGLENIDMSNVQCAYKMFSDCFELTSLNLSTWDTGNMTDMSFMFYECLNLKTIKFGAGWKTDNVKSMFDMFCSCLSLGNLDLNTWNTSKVTDMTEMFYDCKNMTYIDLRSFKTSNVAEVSLMFGNTPANKYGSDKHYFYNEGIGANNLSKWEYSSSTNKDYQSLVGTDSKLKRIYIGDGWKTSSFTENGSYLYSYYSLSKPTEYSMFFGCTNLVGANGTKYSNSYKNKTYARNDVEGTAGLLTQFFELKDTRDDNGSQVGNIADIQTGLADALTGWGGGEPVPTRLTRTLSAGGWNTLCLPFDVSKDTLNKYYPNNGLKLMTLESASYSGGGHCCYS